MQQGARNACAAIATLFQRYCCIGWTAWAIFVLIALARTHPRRFGSTFSAYLDAAQRSWTGQQVYDPTTLGDFLYFPLTLLIYTPLTLLDRVPAAAIALALGAVFFTWACATLTLSLLSADWRSRDAIAVAGVVLLINIPAAWFNFKGVQAQVPMTALGRRRALAVPRHRHETAGDRDGVVVLGAGARHALVAGRRGRRRDRATLMAGRMPSVHDVRSNGPPLSLESSTVIDALCVAGCARRLSARAIYRIFPIFRQSSSGRRRGRAIRCSTRNLRGPSVAPDACGTMSGPFASPFEPHTLCGWCASPRR